MKFATIMLLLPLMHAQSLLGQNGSNISKCKQPALSAMHSGLLQDQPQQNCRAIRVGACGAKVTDDCDTQCDQRQVVYKCDDGTVYTNCDYDKECAKSCQPSPTKMQRSQQ